MEIPWRSLDADTLERLLQEIVSRDGTDYGSDEKSLADKVIQAKKALESGKAAILWDADSETSSLTKIL